MGVNRESLYDWFGPDLQGIESLEPEFDWPEILVDRLAHKTSLPLIGVWPDEPGGLALGPFGRLRALARLQLGRPIDVAASVQPFLKLVTFVPGSHLETVRAAISQSGAGHIGDYSHCTFSSPGQGTFLPGGSTKPFIGQQGKLEHVAEHRLETIVPFWKRDRVEQALRTHHPYEEVAFDWIGLANRLELPLGYESPDGEWWTAEVTPHLGWALTRRKPSALHTEKISWEWRRQLLKQGIAVDIFEPGEILLEGLIKLKEDPKLPWQ